jgi:hypothetical protein
MNLYSLFLCDSGKLAKILAANEMSSVTISIPAVAVNA